MVDPYITALRAEGMDHAESAQAWFDEGHLVLPRHSKVPPDAEPDDSAAVCRAFAVTLSMAVGFWAVAIGAVGYAFGWWR